MTVVDSTADEIGVDLEPAMGRPVNLFGTNNPGEVIGLARDTANALRDVLVQQNLLQTISGREHVLVEGWTTLGSMLGVVPVVVWSRPVPGSAREYKRHEKDRNGRWATVSATGQDWEAHVEARTLDGRVVGAADGLCARDEQTWRERDDYALRSMAQTRATSKALRGPLGWIVTLSGFSATPAEELAEPPAKEGAPPTRPGDPVPTGKSDISSSMDPWPENTAEKIKVGGLTGDLRGVLKSFGVDPPARAGVKTVLMGLDGATRALVDRWLGDEEWTEKEAE